MGILLFRKPNMGKNSGGVNIKKIITIVLLVFLAQIVLGSILRAHIFKQIRKDLVIEEEQEASSIYKEDSDYDADGLTYAQELLYKTDPDKRDTDGDGYMDGDEIFSGHDPLRDGGLLPEEFKDINNIKSPEDCKNASETFGACVIKLAVWERNYEYCKLPGVFEPMCLESVASIKRDKDRCLALKESGYQNKCLAGVAKYSLDESVCSLVEADKDYMLKYALETCKLEIAVAKQDKSLCDTLDSAIKNICLSRVSILTNDLETCLTTGTQKKECVDILSKKLKDSEEVIAYQNEQKEKSDKFLEDRREKEEERKKIARERFISNISPVTILLGLVVFLILYLIGNFINAMAYVISLSTLNIKDPNTTYKCLKISAVTTGLEVFALFFHYVVSSVGYGSLSFNIVLFYLVPLSIVIFFYLFKRYFQTSFLQNIAIYSSSMFVSAIIIQILALPFLMFFIFGLERSGFTGIGF